MAIKKQFDPTKDSKVLTFGILSSRPVVPVPHRKIDTTIETVQGQEQSVEKLFSDYVLGRLDPRQLGGGSYDEEGSEDVDPLNQFGITFEEATQIADAGRNAANEMKQREKVADHPINSSEPGKQPDPRDPGNPEQP